METRLKSCDRWHPGTPAELMIHMNGKRLRKRCLACGRIQVRDHREAKQPAKTRLLSCDRWHPNEPAELTPYRRLGRKGSEEVISRCRSCHRYREQTRRKEGTQHKPFTPYGVLPRLDWAPPQFSTGELT